MARRLFRTVLWVVKAGLLAIALGAVVFWGWSYSHSGVIQSGQLTRENRRLVQRVLLVGWGEGRVGFEWEQADMGESEELLLMLASVGLNPDRPGWIWHRSPWTWPDFERGLDGGQLFRPVGWQMVKHESVDGSDHTLKGAIHLWLVALVAGVWPMVALVWSTRRRWRIRQRRRTGCCLTCGYDLRGLSELADARCPECGMVRTSDISPIAAS